MELKMTGGQAFPSSDGQTAHAIAAAAISGLEHSAERDRVYTEVHAQARQGMTLRDYFAAAALPAILAVPADGVAAWAPTATSGSSLTAAEAWAQNAYQIADAMLAERVK